MDSIFSNFLNLNSKLDDIIKVPLSNKVDLQTDNYKGIVWELLSYSNETSKSLRLLIKENLVKPAYAILRIRLEQTIISSYLIHSDEKDGFKPYFLQSGIDLLKIYNSTASVPQNKIIFDSLLKSVGVDEEYYKSLADLAQNEKNKDKEKVSDKYDREWTNLDLKSIAHKRDELNNDNSIFSNLSLESFYSTIYKGASSLIHSDILVMASSFNKSLDEFNCRNIAMNNLIYDLLQAYELTKYLEYNYSSELENLYKESGEIFKKYLGVL
ncbi:MAG: DUF5677 domain-containing protein [Candidatus Lokiarchaeota archaeon]|nr:DUF5677 domain-containing protein [Candidatus Lokiarchaeota archaeon]